MRHRSAPRRRCSPLRSGQHSAAVRSTARRSQRYRKTRRHPYRQHRRHPRRQPAPPPTSSPQPGSRPRQCPRCPRPKVATAWYQKPWQKPGTPPDRAWLCRGQSLHDDATRRAGTRPQTYPFVSYCLHLEHCPAAAPRHRAHCARVPPSGSPFPPEPNAYRRHAPRPRTRWEAIRLNLTDPGAPSDLRRGHPGPRGITVTGTAGDLHPDSPKHAGKPRIRASPHHHLGHRLLLSIW